MDYLTKQQLAEVRAFVDKNGYIDPESYNYFICDGYLTLSLYDEDGMIADQIAFKIEVPESHYEEDGPVCESLRNQVNEAFLNELFRKENEKLRELFESSPLKNEEWFHDFKSDIFCCSPYSDEMIIKTIPKHLAMLTHIDDDYIEEEASLIKAELARWVAEYEPNPSQNG